MMDSELILTQFCALRFLELDAEYQVFPRGANARPRYQEAAREGQLF